MMPVNGNNERKALDERRKYIEAWNTTMVQIWRERITLLGVIDTGTLLHSVVPVYTRADGRFVSVEFRDRFAQYGVYQNYGTGRETPRGNPGDIGRDKVRVPRPWLVPKHYASIMNIKEFMADNLGREFLGVVSDVLDNKKIRGV